MEEAKRDIRYTTAFKMRKRCPGMVFIYGLADPRDHLIRYVGKTQCRLETRLEGHLKRPVSRGMRSWLSSLQRVGIVPEIVPIEVCRKFEWELRESHWIGKLKENLLNVSPGELPPAETRTLGKGAMKTLRRARLAAVEIAALSGPVRILTREEIEAEYGQQRDC